MFIGPELTMRRCFTLPTAICIDDIVPVLTVEQDDTPVHGNAIVSGDDAIDKQCEDEINRRLDSGDVWAWAAVTVTVTALGFTGTAHLGCCSYADEHDFRVTDGAFRDMVEEANVDLIQQLHDAGFVPSKDGA